MSVVASYVYRDGKRAGEVPLGSDPYSEKDGEFVWIGLVDPTPEEMDNLKSMFGLHPLAAEDALNGQQVPKVDVYGEQLFVVAKTAHLEGDKIVYGETCILSVRIISSPLGTVPHVATMNFALNSNSHPRFSCRDRTMYCMR